MRLDLYQAETARIAAEQAALLNQAREVLAQGISLTKLEQSGLLHALQILIENAIGKAKQILKARNVPVPVSAYDTFAALVGQGEIETTQLQAWNAVIGLRNRIVHDYMNIDMNPDCPLGRHTGEGRYPVIKNAPRSGQNHDVVPLPWGIIDQLDSRLRGNDTILANGLSGMNRVLEFVQTNQDKFIVEFLLKPIAENEK